MKGGSCSVWIAWSFPVKIRLGSKVQEWEVEAGCLCLVYDIPWSWNAFLIPLSVYQGRI